MGRNTPGVDVRRPRLYKNAMGVRRGGALSIMLLVLLTAILGVVADPYFERLSHGSSHPQFLADDDVRPAWRIPGTMEEPRFVPVLGPAADLMHDERPPALPVVTRTLLIPPRQ